MAIDYSEEAICERDPNYRLPGQCDRVEASFEMTKDEILALLQKV